MRSQKLASKVLSLRMVRSMGGWHTMLPFLHPHEQVGLQGLNHWTYEISVPRAQTSIPIYKVFYFSAKEDIVELRSPSNKVTILRQNDDSDSWSSLQIEKNIFKVHQESGQSRLLKNTGFRQFRVMAKAQMIAKVRKFSSCCSLDDNFIFVTGGSDASGEMSSVERYSIATDVWEEMPQMNEGRMKHGSCFLGNAVFAIFGSNVQNSIEKLEIRDLQAGWQTLIIPSISHQRRQQIVVAVLNSSEILIMGGIEFFDLTSHFILDTRANTIKTIRPRKAHIFQSFGGEAKQVRSGVILAMVKSKKDYKLLGYNNGDIRYLYQKPDCPQDSMAFIN